MTKATSATAREQAAEHARIPESRRDHGGAKRAQVERRLRLRGRGRRLAAWRRAGCDRALTGFLPGRRGLRNLAALKHRGEVAGEGLDEPAADVLEDASIGAPTSKWFSKRMSPPAVYRCRPIASTSASSAARLWPLMSSSTYGKAAAMPPVTGAKPRAATRGLTQTPCVTGWFVSLPASMIAPSLKRGRDKGSICAYRLDRSSSQNSSFRPQATAPPTGIGLYSVSPSGPGKAGYRCSRRLSRKLADSLHE